MNTIVSWTFKLINIKVILMLLYLPEIRTLIPLTIGRLRLWVLSV